MAMHQLAIFIDGAYLNKVIEKQFNGVEINYEALPKWISNQCRLDEPDVMRTYFYDALPWHITEESLSNNKPRGQHCRDCLIDSSKNDLREKEEFFERLEEIPRFEVRLGRVAFRGWKKWNNPDGVCVHGLNNRSPYLKQKGVDLRVAVDIVHFASTQRIRRAVLIAGDSDYVPAIEVVKMHGVVIKLIHGGKKNPPHRKLLLSCDERLELDDEHVSHFSMTPDLNSK